MEVQRGGLQAVHACWTCPRRKPRCSSPGLGNLSAPNGKGENGCGGLGIILVLEGTQGGFLVCLGVQQCALAPEQGFSFPAGQQGESRGLFLGECFCEGFLLLCPSPPHQWLCCARSWGPFRAHRAVSDGTPWTSGRQQGFFILCMDELFCVSYNLQGRLSQGWWLSADPSLCVSANVVLTLSRGAATRI